MSATTLGANQPVPSAARSLQLRHVLAVGLGNALEFYDWLTFSVFAVQIAHSFFPATATSHGLLLTLATFGAGFVTRPIGAVVIGSIGDRIGRKPAMLLAFALMGVAITGVALTPSYDRIGVAAPGLLLVFRLIQGFALGGDVGPTTAYLIEAAPPHRRGLYVSVQYATQDLALVVAGGVGLGLATLLDPASLNNWGWRIAFLLGSATVPLGLVVRRNLPETLEAGEPRLPSRGRSGIPMSAGDRPESPRVPRRVLILGLLMLAATTIATYVQDYIGTFAQASLHLSAAAAFGATAIGWLCAVAADLLSGFCSDRLGRKPVMLVAVVLLIAALVPTYSAMIRHPRAATLYCSAALLCMLLRLAGAPAIITITESLPKAVRSTGLATLYAVAVAIFGGTTQFVVKLLSDSTGSPLAPALYATGALAVGAIAMALARETAPVRVGARAEGS